MTINPERCSQLRKLRTQLNRQIQLLKENMQKQEQGVDSSIESLNTLKVLQSSLNKIVLELEQCPPTEEDTATPVPDAKGVRFWYPEEERAQEGQTSIGEEDE